MLMFEGEAMRDTIDMAHEAGIKNDLDGVWCDIDQLVTFVALVRADEREACAKLCDEFDIGILVLVPSTRQKNVLAAAIRTRGETK
jgi:hypothetical protein